MRVAPFLFSRVSTGDHRLGSITNGSSLRRQALQRETKRLTGALPTAGQHVAYSIQRSYRFRLYVTKTHRQGMHRLPRSGPPQGREKGASVSRSLMQWTSRMPSHQPALTGWIGGVLRPRLCVFAHRRASPHTWSTWRTGAPGCQAMQNVPHRSDLRYAQTASAPTRYGVS